MNDSEATLSTRRKTGEQTGSARSGTHVVFAALAAIFVLAIAIRAVRTGIRPAIPARGGLEALSLLDADLDGDYPASPEALIALNGRFILCLYGGGAEENQIPELVKKQRGLFAAELLKLNPEEAAAAYAAGQIRRMNGCGLKLTGMEAGEPVYDTGGAAVASESERYGGISGSPRSCSVTVIEYMTHGMSDSFEYVLVRENERWKINGISRIFR